MNANRSTEGNPYVSANIDGSAYHYLMVVLSGTG